MYASPSAEYILAFNRICVKAGRVGGIGGFALCVSQYSLARSRRAHIVHVEAVVQVFGCLSTQLRKSGRCVSDWYTVFGNFVGRDRLWFERLVGVGVGVLQGGAILPPGLDPGLGMSVWEYRERVVRMLTK